MMDVLLKIRMKTGEHVFREDVYTRSLKYRMWNNQLRPFCSLKKREANIFRKRNLVSDDSRGSSMQSIVNYMEREGSVERTVINQEKRESVNSDWSDLIPVDVEAEYSRVHKREPSNKSHVSPGSSAAPNSKGPVLSSSPDTLHKTAKNIVLVPY